MDGVGEVKGAAIDFLFLLFKCKIEKYYFLNLHNICILFTLR